MYRLILSIANLGRYISDNVMGLSTRLDVLPTANEFLEWVKCSRWTIRCLSVGRSWPDLVSRSMGDAILLGHYFARVHGHVTSRRSKDDYVINEE